jgi:DNA-binding transcriptional regulator LsrR (DeoR family)
MSNELVNTLYEEGRTVDEIAEAMEIAPSEVTDLLAKTDDTQTVQVTRHQKHVRDLRRIRALADGMTQKYLETLNAVIDDPDSTADEKANAFGEMDKVIRISKLSSDRVLLAEGKTTENIGVNGSAGMPFNVVFTKTYETPDGLATEGTENSEE